MRNASPLSVGDRVNTGTQVGVMGATRKCNWNPFTLRTFNT